MTTTGKTTKAPQLHPCACGCGTQIARTFVRGHDSKLGKQLRADYAAGKLTRAQVLAAAKKISERFHGKMTRSIAQVDAKAKAAKAKAAA